MSNSRLIKSNQHNSIKFHITSGMKIPKAEHLNTASLPITPRNPKLITSRCRKIANHFSGRTNVIQSTIRDYIWSQYGTRTHHSNGNDVVAAKNVNTAVFAKYEVALLNEFDATVGFDGRNNLWDFTGAFINRNPIHINHIMEGYDTPKAKHLQTVDMQLNDINIISNESRTVLSYITNHFNTSTTIRQSIMREVVLESYNKVYGNGKLSNTKIFIDIEKQLIAFCGYKVGRKGSVNWWMT